MQLTMGAIRNPAASDGWSRLFEAIKNATALISPKELAYSLDIQPSYLHDAMRGVERKSLKLEWLPTIICMAPEESVDAILGAQACLRSRKVERVKPLTKEERLDALEAQLVRMGAKALLDMANEQIDGGRR